MIKNSSCRSRAEKINNCDTLCDTLFKKVGETKGFRPNTETQKSHRQGGQLFPLVCFRETHKGFQRIDSTKIRENETS